VEFHTLLPQHLAKILDRTLTHLLKNTITHDIQLPEEREREQRPLVGVIRVSTINRDDELTERLYVEDDGAGVAQNPLLSAAAERARPLQTDETPSGSFRAAKEQIDNELSGRGMGLSAVVRELTAAGFSLSVHALTTGGTRFEIQPIAAPALKTGALS
ncbi:MAG TPA: ATP-binding protein, partial [Polyangiaceae bacterium]|nr:ATP-binding protein [Polyangiaceae bacterium]